MKQHLQRDTQTSDNTCSGISTVQHKNGVQ